MVQCFEYFIDVTISDVMFVIRQKKYFYLFWYSREGSLSWLRNSHHLDNLYIPGIAWKKGPQTAPFLAPALHPVRGHQLLMCWNWRGQGWCCSPAQRRVLVGKSENPEITLFWTIYQRYPWVPKIIFQNYLELLKVSLEITSISSGKFSTGMTVPLTVVRDTDPTVPVMFPSFQEYGFFSKLII